MNQDGIHTKSSSSVLIQSDVDPDARMILRNRCKGEDPKSFYTTISFETPAVKLQSKVWFEEASIRGLINFFNQLSLGNSADNNQGHSWGTTEGELNISASTKKTGRTTLTIELANYFGDHPWSAQVTLIVYLQALENVSKNLKSFFLDQAPDD